MTKARIVRVSIALLVLLCLGGLAFAFRANLAPILASVESLVKRAGSFGALVFACIYGVWGFLLLPAAPLIALAGTLYASSPLIGAAVISIGSAISQGMAFLVASRLARQRVRDRVGTKAWFLKLEEQTERRGARAVFVYRVMMFLPQSPANYAFGLTSVRFWPYILASWLGTLPSAFLYAGGIAGLVHLFKQGI